MSATIAAVLGIALIVISISSAISIYFVCKLVEKVTKLTAAGTPEEYHQLVRVDEKPKPEPVAEKMHYASDDGTLDEETISKIASKIE